METKSPPLADALSNALHQLLASLRLTDLGHWSESLHGIGMLDLGVLYHAAEDPQALLGDIRQALDVPHSTLSSAVNRLERKGLLRRTISDQDRRSFRLELTPAGLQAHAEHLRVDAMLANRVLSALFSDAERQAFVDMLHRIANALD